MRKAPSIERRPVLAALRDRGAWWDERAMIRTCGSQEGAPSWNIICKEPNLINISVDALLGKRARAHG